MVHAFEMDFEHRTYVFPNLLPGEGGEPGIPNSDGDLAKLRKPQALTRVKYIVTHGSKGEVLVAEYICDSLENYILVPGWVRTEATQLKNGQLRINVRPLTKEEQQEHEWLVFLRFMSDGFLKDEHNIVVRPDTPIVFWNIEE